MVIHCPMFIPNSRVSIIIPTTQKVLVTFWVCLDLQCRSIGQTWTTFSETFILYSIGNTYKKCKKCLFQRKYLKKDCNFQPFQQSNGLTHTLTVFSIFFQELFPDIQFEWQRQTPSIFEGFCIVKQQDFQIYFSIEQL